MKGKRFAVEQIVSILKQAELGMPVADIIRKSGSPSRRSTDGRSNTLACSRTRSRNCGSFQEENARLKKLVAELSLDKAILQDVATKKWGGPR